MTGPRRLLLALTILVAMTSLMAFPGTVGATQNSNQPVVVTVDETFRARNLTRICGVKVTAHVSGTFTFNVLPSGVELQHINYQHVFSGPGGSVSFSHVENVKFTSTISPDGTRIDTFIITGTLLYHAVVPGYGSIGNNSGREIIQYTWEHANNGTGYILVDEQVLFDMGPNDGLSDADFAAICEQLDVD